MNLKFVLVPFVIVVIGLGIVSGFDLAEGQKVITKTVTGTSFVTVTTTQTEIQLSTILSTILSTKNPQAVETITEQIQIEYLASYNVYVFGNCTAGAGTIQLIPTASTIEYVFPSDTTGVFYATITTIDTDFYNSTTTVTLYTSLQPQTITIVNGTSTSFSTQTCPTFS